MVFQSLEEMFDAYMKTLHDKSTLEDEMMGVAKIPPALPAVDSLMYDSAMATVYHHCQVLTHVVKYLSESDDYRYVIERRWNYYFGLRMVA